MDTVLQRLDTFIAWTKGHQGRKLIRFTAVSAVSTAVSVVVIALVYGLKIIKGEVEATLIGNIIGAVPSYSLNRRWTWGKTGRSHVRKELLPFWTMAVLGIAFSMVGASYAKSIVHSHHWSHLFNTGIVDGANLVSFAIFWILKLIVFNRIFHVREEMENETIIIGERSSREIRN